MNTPLTIIHAPHGDGSPYVFTLAERSPQDPVGGDMVTLSFLTEPGDASTAVTLHWTRNGRAQTPIGGRAQARYASFDRWLFELGVLEAGDVVEYWLVANSGGQQVASQRFHFVTRRLRTLAGLADVWRGEGEVSARMLDAAGKPGPRLVIAADPAQPSLLRLTVASSDSRDPHAACGLNERREAGGAAKGDKLALTAVGGLQLAADAGRLHLCWPERGLDLPLALRWLEEGDGALAAVEISGELQAGEALVGFGERYDAVNQRGRALDTTVYEQYKNHGNRSYLPVPYFCSSRGYSCLVEGTARVQYDLGRTVPDRWRCLAFTGKDRQVAAAWMGGAPLENLRTLTALTGRPQTAPPDWVFGPWMSSNEWNTQSCVEQEVRTTEALDIPATALVIEAWSDETTFYTWNGAQYTPRPGDKAPRLEDFTFPADGPWPDPKGMADRLHAAGIRLVLWQIPALKALEGPHAQHDADATHAVARGYVMRRTDGTPYRNPAFWFHDALIPDFTEAEATDWWLSKRAYLLEQMGIDGFKTDGGEHLQGEDVCAADGRGGSELANVYPNLYVGAYHRFAQEKRSDAVTFSRAGYTGAGAFPAHWAGDENSTWEAFRRSLHAGLSAALSGVLFWGWDIAGFSEALPSAELYLRAAAMAAFCPIMQYHSEYRAPGEPSKDRTPWNIQTRSGDERVVPLYRQFAKLRMELIPYLRSEAAHCTANGEPLLRPLLLDSPDDPMAWQVFDQYRLGRDLLVAPVLEEGTTTRRLYLPAGQWRDFWSDRLYEGMQFVEVPAPLERIPVFVRAGGIDRS